MEKQVVAIGEGVVGLVEIDENNTVRFPEGTRYRENAEEGQWTQFWMLPTGHILSYNEIVEPAVQARIDLVTHNRENNLPRLCVIETPEWRVANERQGFRTWTQWFNLV